MVCVSTVTFIIGTNSEGEQEKLKRTALEEDITANDSIVKEVSMVRKWIFGNCYFVGLTQDNKRWD